MRFFEFKTDLGDVVIDVDTIYALTPIGSDGLWKYRLGSGA